GDALAVTSSDQPAAIVTVLEYDALGNLTARTEASGRAEQRTTRYQYDQLGRQIKTIFPSVAIYDASADTLSTTGVAARTEKAVPLWSETRYNALGDAVASRDVSGNWSYKAYDARGRVRYDIDAAGYVVGY